MCNIDNPVYDTQGYCFQFNPDYMHFSQTIEIKKLEQILLAYIKKNYKKQVTIIHKNFTKDDTTNYKVIVGADGQKSFVREKLMKVRWIKLKDYESYVLHIKYKDLSNKKHLIKNTPNIEKIRRVFDLKLKRFGSIYKQPIDQDRFRLIRSNKTKTQFLLQINKTTYNKIKDIKVYRDLPYNTQKSMVRNVFRRILSSLN